MDTNRIRHLFDTPGSSRSDVRERHRAEIEACGLADVINEDPEFKNGLAVTAVLAALGLAGDISPPGMVSMVIEEEAAKPLRLAKVVEVQTLATYCERWEGRITQQHFDDAMITLLNHDVIVQLVADGPLKVGLTEKGKRITDVFLKVLRERGFNI